MDFYSLIQQFTFIKAKMFFKHYVLNIGYVEIIIKVITKKKRGIIWISLRKSKASMRILENY